MVLDWFELDSMLVWRGWFLLGSQSLLAAVLRVFYACSLLDLPLLCCIFFMVHGWFMVGSLLVHGWFTAGSWLVHGWFTVFH